MCSLWGERSRGKGIEASPPLTPSHPSLIWFPNWMVLPPEKLEWAPVLRSPRDRAGHRHPQPPWTPGWAGRPPSTPPFAVFAGSGRPPSQSQGRAQGHSPSPSAALPMSSKPVGVRVSPRLNPRARGHSSKSTHMLVGLGASYSGLWPADLGLPAWLDPHPQLPECPRRS